MTSELKLLAKKHERRKENDMKKLTPALMMTEMTLMDQKSML